jgi:hypothetical protein
VEQEEPSHELAGETLHSKEEMLDGRAEMAATPVQLHPGETPYTGTDWEVVDVETTLLPQSGTKI